MLIVDAHEDLAWNALTFGRDYLRPVSETRRLEAGGASVAHNGDSLIGWPDWVAGRVAVVFATLFVAPERSRMGPWERACYHDAASAHDLYAAQLRHYHEWTAAHPSQLQLVRQPGDLAALLATWQGDGPRRVGLVLLMEGAEGIRTPAEVAWWAAQGVRLIGPAWVGTRYSGGSGEPGPFSAAGHALLDEMARQGVALDLSHLAEEAVSEALARFEGRLCATHANPRALLPSARVPERHLSDGAIRAIAARDGVVGVVLFNAFLRDGYSHDSARASSPLSLVAEHIDYLCQLIGDPWHVGLGSDFDGGFGLRHAPHGLDSVADLPRLGEALAAQGFPDAHIHAILGNNWLRFLDALLQGHQ